MDLTPIVTAPAELLLALWRPSGFETESEARADLAISLGVMFWILLLVVGILSWRRWQSGAKALTGIVVESGLAGWETTTRQWRAFVGPLTWRRTWGVVWRAEVAHLVVYALLPLGWAAGRAMLFVLFMPFSVMSFGDQPGEKGTFDHLRRPECWTFASLCASPSAQLRELTALEQTACQQGKKCPDLPISYSDRWQMAWKLLWAVLATLWIARWWSGGSVALAGRDEDIIRRR